jgi:APA family basic amino acid/polyamine antiporter
MASDGVFLTAVAQFHPRFRTPVHAIGIMGLMTSLLIVLGAFEQITAYFLFVAVLFIGLTVCTLFVFRRRGTPVSVKTPLYPVTPLIFVLEVVALLAAILTSTAWQALPGCAVVLLGLPVYTFLQREHVVAADYPSQKTLQNSSSSLPLQLLPD